MADASLLLIDGMAVIYRAFYGIKDLATSDGRPTNALYGFIRILDHLRESWAPTHMIVVFDGGLPEERTQLLESYKAGRDPMPDPLEEQLEAIDEYLDAADIPWLMMAGEEADDVLATIAFSAAATGAQVHIATSDKDLYQLVTADITIVSPSRKGPHMGVVEVEDKMGVPPEQMIDWQALVGDTADNIPGVPGVGPKTAAKWLHQYGTVKGVFEHIDEMMPERFRTILAEHRENVLRNLKLVRLRTDLDCQVDWRTLPLCESEPEKLLVFFEKYELHSLAKALRED